MRVLLIALAFTPPGSTCVAAACDAGARVRGAIYLPARTPLFYRLRPGAAVRNGVLTVEFVDRARIRAGVWKWTKTFAWQVRLPAASADCRGVRATAQKTLQIGGNKIDWSPDKAWRCIGHHVLLAFDASGRLPDTALGEVVASGLNVAVVRRESSLPERIGSVSGR